MLTSALRVTDLRDLTTNKPGLKRETGLARDSFQAANAILFRQTYQQRMARVQPGELGLEPLSSALHTPEGKVQKPEQHSLALSKHRLVYKPGQTPSGHNTKELSAHTREHKPPLEQHSLA